VLHGVGLTATIVLLLVFLSCAGVTYPNAAAIAMAPFTRNAGSASAMLGFLQLGVGALASAGVGLLNSRTSVPIVSLMSGTTLIGLAILLFGQGRVARARHRIS
jgi:DHA1 family bicyclomycin/chloramphenicol resistance-like MFS transporter